ncbi:FMN-dependent NADH-azoreductase [Jiangella asiatica]|uniref:FMN dependent NADH:quinone oxidoreductase n=1 Tax=Jiangella asiatica TaxID=2530372 RepID=A0A4R5D5V0_9ACTN|nr:NAD(P)H-dependent oxidoreductase [Jiangella asiatica]TDE07927.1 flavodoxin family protein [Jiangella asiatica]
MTTLLHISASPRGNVSESLVLADEFVAAYRQANPGAEARHWDLWDGTLPEFGPTAAHAKMAIFAGQDLDDTQRTVWKDVTAAFARFDAADHYLFSVPMWNAGLPYVLKQFIDVVSQPGLVFEFHPELGYRGLLRGKKAAVIYTSGVYAPGRGPAFGSNFQSPYLEDWLRWAGVEDIRTVSLRPDSVVGDPADPEAGRRAARAAASAAAATF